MPSLNPSTHIARYSGAPYTIGVSGGEGDAEGDVSAAAAEGEVTIAARSPGAQPLRTSTKNRARPRFRVKRSRKKRDCARLSQSLQDGRAPVRRTHPPSRPARGSPPS